MRPQTALQFGTIDVLVNNAGLQKYSPFHEMALDDRRAVIDLNVTGQFLCTRAVVREFLRRGVVPEVSTPEAEAELLELSPYGRIGRVKDVAMAAVRLASDEADYISGTTLYVDGSMMLYSGTARHG